jgi:hypothetical protein
MKMLKIKSDHGGKFENQEFDTFSKEMRIKHEYLSPKAPFQNRVVEKKIEHYKIW